MKLHLALLSLSLILSSNFVFAETRARLDYGPKFLSPTEEIKTPHISWMRPRKGGPLKVLIIAYGQNGGMREIVELRNRIDIEYDVIPMASKNRFSSSMTTVTEEILKKLLEEKLKNKYDAIILGNVDWTALPLSCRYQILKKVKEGTSLFGCAGKTDRYLGVAANRKSIKPELSFLAPLKGLAEFEKLKDFSSFIKSTISASKFGKGKVVLIKGYQIPVPQMLTPGYAASPLENHWVDYDYYLGIVAQLLLYAADKVPEIQIKGPDHILSSRDPIKPFQFLICGASKNKLLCETIIRDKENHILFEGKKELLPLSSGVPLAINPGKLPAGEYFIDIWVKESGKTVNFGSSFLELTSDDKIKKIDLPESLKKDQAVKGKVVLDTKGKGEYSVRITRRDTRKRITDRQSISLNGKNEIDFSLPPGKPLTVIQYIDIELLKDNELIDRKSAFFSISDLWPKEDIRCMTWDSNYGNSKKKTSYLTQYYMEALESQGFDTHYTSYFNCTYPWMGVDFSPGIFLANRNYTCTLDRFTDTRSDHYPQYFNGKRVAKRERNDHVRFPCLSDPHYLKAEKDKFTQIANRLKKYSVREFSLGDESRFGGNRITELCFSETCVAAFHEFLKKEYGSIDKLNEEYESNYKKFEEALPVTYSQAKENPKLIPLWTDYKIHMENTWAGIFDKSQDFVRKTIPGSIVGYEGSDSKVSSFYAADFYKLMKVMRLNNPYKRPFQNHALDSFKEPGTILGMGWFGGFAPCRNKEFYRNICWSQLFEGANSFWIWNTTPGGTGSVVASDFSFFDDFKECANNINEIKGGIGKLFMTSQRDYGGIGLLYSASSVHASALTSNWPTMNDVLNSWCMLLDEARYPFRVVAYKELENGFLQKNNYRVLILPFVQSISKKEAEQIKDFVKNGGTVIADIRPGILDKHCKPYKKGALDELFGISQDTKNSRPEMGKIEIKSADIQNTLPPRISDKSLKIEQAKALGENQGSPVLIINDYGKGKAILLNMSLADFTISKGSLESGTTRLIKSHKILEDLIDRILKLTGNGKKIKISSDAESIKNYIYKNGAQTYVGFLQELPESTLKYSMRTARPLTSKPIQIKFPRKSFVYDMRKGECLGKTDSIKTEIEPGLAKLYSLMPYKVESVDITAPKETLQGKRLDYEIKISAKTDHFDPHIVNVSFVSPEGKKIPYYTKNVKVENGLYRGSIDLALNETPGEWKIFAKDAASGKTNAHRFTIKENK